MTDKEEIEYLKEQVALLKEINKLKDICSKKPWPTRVEGLDMDLFRGNCIS